VSRRWHFGRAWGLRARLVFAFALLCVVTAAAVAGGIYVQARNAILQRAQDAAVQAMTSRLEAVFPLPSPAPGPAELGEIADTVTDRSRIGPGCGPPGPPGSPPGQGSCQGSAVAVYHEAHSPDGLDPGVIPAPLRRAVARGALAWQRVVWQGEPVLIIGAPLLIAEPDGTTRMSGIEVYVARSLLPEQRSIDGLAASAWLTGGVALAFAVVVALLATRGVLRPVRELGRAARHG
jgi:hypothetical protein